MPLYLFNTLHRRKEQFMPLHPPEVGFYSCGPTVYDRQHIGNMRAALFADLVKRVLVYNGYNVTHVRNITDVGHLTDDADQGVDKMEKGAAREGKSPQEIAQYYTDLYHDDLKNLNVLPPTVEPKATEHIEVQIQLITELEKKGFTYIIDDGVYFDVSKFPSYGQMAQLDLEGLQEGARVAVNKEKRNAADFALWKFSPKGEKRLQEWDSPWGIGFPGWHIECSAMAMEYLGETFDIHSGGIDHVPVHHTNEIAQSEAATEKPFARYWLHNEFLALGDEAKMSKSAGTFLTIQELMKKGYDALDFRFAFLQTHYRSHMKFSWQMMDAAREGRERLNQFARRIYSMKEFHIDAPDDKYLVKKQIEFQDEIDDDLNAPAALAVVFDLVKDINSQISNQSLGIEPSKIWGWLIDVDQVLGLDLEKTAKSTEELPEKVKELLARRQVARDNKDWDNSDRLRDQIEKEGYVVEDTDQGQKTHPV